MEAQQATVMGLLAVASVALQVRAMELPPSLVTELHRVAAGPLVMRMGATLPAVGTELLALVDPAEPRGGETKVAPLDRTQAATLLVRVATVAMGLLAVAEGLLGEQAVVADGLNLLRRGMEHQALEVTAATTGEYQLKVGTVLLLMAGRAALENRLATREGAEGGAGTEERDEGTEGMEEEMEGRDRTDGIGGMEGMEGV